MRSSKSILAGVAAGALAAGMMVGLGAAPANAATVAATTSPVRTTFAGSSLEQVPYASISWTATTNLATNDSAVVTLLAAPSPTATLGFKAGEQVGTAAAYTTSFGSATNVSLTTNAQTLNAYYDTGNGAKAAVVAVAADTAGSYSGTIQAYRAGVAEGDPAAFSFTTTGAPTSMTLTPAAQTVPVNGTATMVAELKSSSGGYTQPLCVDTVTTAASPTSGGSPQAVTACGGSGDNYLYDGKAEFTFSPTAAGTYAISATPGGTLPAAGITAQTVSVTADSTIAPASTIITAPTAGLSTSATVYTEPASVTAGAPATSTVYAATSVKDITFQVTGATPGAKVAYTVADSVSTPAGVTDGTGTVTLGADGTATFSVSAANPFATGPTAGSTYTVTVGVSTGNRVVYTIQYGTTNTVNVGNITLSPLAGTTSYVKTGTAVPVTATVTNQFGLPLAGAVVASTPSASTGATATTGADGTATISVAAPASSATTTQTATFTATFGGTTTGATSAVTFIYNDSGAPTSLSLASTAGTVAATALVTQNVDTAGNTTGVWAATNATTKTQWMAVTATVGGAVSGVPVTFSGDGAYFNVGSGDNLDNTATKAGTYTAATAGGTVTAYVKATKTGTATITVTAGTLSETISWTAANQSTDARVVTLTPAEQSAAARATLTAKVTDAFGNSVAGVSLTFSEVGAGIFANGASTLVAATGPTGVVSVEDIATEDGESSVTVSGSWTGTADSPVTGAPAAVTSASAKVMFTSTKEKSITIVGERTTVSGKPGIRIEGITTGIEDGKTVIPYYRFPGQTEYSQGSARPEVNDDEFTWQRKTGKKFYAYVTNDDGLVKSNRVIIQAK